MKKLWFSIGIVVMFICTYGQTKVVPLGRNGWRTEISGTSIRLIPLTHTPGYILAINSAKDIVEIPNVAGWSPILASTVRAGIVKVDGTSITIGLDSVLHASPGAGEPIIVAGSSTQYWRGDKTWQTLNFQAITNFPTVSGQSGKVLTNDGTNLSWNTLSGGSGLADAYTSITDGTNTATSSGATTFKIRTANNRLGVLVTNNDPTHGDNLLLTFNEANVVLTESQVTNLVSDLAGKEPTISSGTTLQFWRGDKSWQTLNTAIVPESGPTNIYFSNARVQTFGDTRYQLLTFHDAFDALSNVDMSGKLVNQVPQWNGTRWVPIDLPSAGVAPTITLTGDVVGSGTPSISTTISAAAVSNSKMANMANGTIKGRITSGAGVPEDLNMTQLKSSAMLDIANFPIQTLQAAVNSAQTTTNGLKLNITNGSPLGVLDASGTTNVKLPRNNDATLQRDTVGIFTFGGGSAIANDTLWVTTSTILGSMWHTGTDTIVITNINFICQGNTPTGVVTLFYGTTFNSGGTAVVTGGTTVTNTTTGQNITSFNNAKIPPGNYVWAKITTAGGTGVKWEYLQGTVSGTKTRKG